MKLIFLQLNEINFEIVQEYLKKGVILNGFKQIINDNLIHTKSEKKYELLEPWIQWPSAHTGKSFEEHGIFRLGDSVNCKDDQIFEKIENLGFKVGAISPMNSSNNLKNPSYFIPDPWTQTNHDGSFLSKIVYESLSQAVNDNSEGKITLKTYVYLILSILITTPFKNYFLLIKYAFSCLKYRYRKAIFLDMVIFRIHQYLFKKRNTNFSTLFLNGGAHIQHHYFFNSKVLSHLNLKNPDWYLSKYHDPILDLLICYDNFIKEILELKNVELLIATGLSQAPFDSQKYYYRLRNHKSFLKSLGINFSEVFPRMTRDFLVTFASKKDTIIAEELLSSLKVNQGMPLFSEIDNRGNELFVTLTYPKEISKKEYINIGCKKIFLKNEVVFVAIKNGMHQEKGFAYFSKKISKYAPKNGDHVKELHNSIFNFFRLSNQ